MNRPLRGTEHTECTCSHAAQRTCRTRPTRVHCPAPPCAMTKKLCKRQAQLRPPGQKRLKSRRNQAANKSDGAVIYLPLVAEPTHQRQCQHTSDNSRKHVQGGNKQKHTETWALKHAAAFTHNIPTATTTHFCQRKGARKGPSMLLRHTVTCNARCARQNSTCIEARCGSHPFVGPQVQTSQHGNMKSHKATAELRNAGR